jgi:hypothetical protein
MRPEAFFQPFSGAETYSIVAAAAAVAAAVTVVARKMMETTTRRRIRWRSFPFHFNNNTKRSNCAAILSPTKLLTMIWKKKNWCCLLAK